jgi:hypothetical protein
MPPMPQRRTSAGNPQAAELFAKARQAIANGAPREAVMQRLREMGVDPMGL